MSRRKAPIVPPCEPTGSLREPEVCNHPRVCADEGCRAPLRRVGVFEVPGVHSWGWADLDGHSNQVTYPWGEGPEPDGWWEALAERDIATYSVLQARWNLCMLGQHHRHEPAPCPNCHGLRAAPVPECCGWPMWRVVEGWRCRPNRTLVPYDRSVR